MTMRPKGCTIEVEVGLVRGAPWDIFVIMTVLARFEHMDESKHLTL